VVVAQVIDNKQLQPRISMLFPLADRGPLRVLFAIDTLHVGGAEVLTYELVRRLDRHRFSPEVACMRELGELGKKLKREYPVHANLLQHKFDVRVLWRLKKLLSLGKFDAIVTVGAGDRMFWGRLAARWAKTPVVISALHSTGWPDVVGRANRLLTPWTSAFVGCAARHADYLREVEKFPAERVHWIPNGVDTQRFVPRVVTRTEREQLGLPATGKLVGIVAQLRPEKQHELFLKMAMLVLEQVPDTHFVIIGSGPRRAELEAVAKEYQIAANVHFLGARSDVAQLLPALDVFALTSKMEANPVSILEAQACGVPVVATRVGSIPETVLHGQTGFLATPGSATELASGVTQLLLDSELQQTAACQARQHVIQNWSLDRMVGGYEDLITQLYEAKLPPELRKVKSAEQEFLQCVPVQETKTAPKLVVTE
jgi:glycosyltransferase involved in cell wall biosynthesis